MSSALPVSDGSSTCLRAKTLMAVSVGVKPCRARLRDSSTRRLRISAKPSSREVSAPDARPLRSAA